MQSVSGDVCLRKGREQSVLRRHPWVFSGGVARIGGDPRDGQLVRVLAADGALLGTGHFQAGGSIRVRLLRFGPGEVDSAFWEERLSNALLLRQALGLVASADTTAYRLVHGEGDGLPGLVIDRYADHLVIQFHSEGMAQSERLICAALERVCGVRPDSIHRAGVVAEGEAPGAEIREYGRSFWVDWQRGQKTGFYLDQRENRALVASMAKGKSVLNAFSYSGGFSVSSLAAGAERVVSVDASAQALTWCEENIRRNGLPETRHTAVRADVLDYLRSPAEEFDLIVLDPPAFAKHLSARHRAITAYRRLNAMALRAITPGGIVFTFSCSQVVTPDLFRGAVLAAGIEAKRAVRILGQLHQPADHPVGLFHPESEYLKGLVLSVD